MVIPTFEDVLAAHARIAPHIHRTPVLTSAYLNDLTGAELFLKCENFQKAGAFKRAVEFSDIGTRKKGAASTVEQDRVRITPSGFADCCDKPIPYLPAEGVDRGIVCFDHGHTAATQESYGVFHWDAPIVKTCHLIKENLHG